MSRKQRIDSAAAAVTIMTKQDLVPPSHVRLQDCDQPFWRSVLAEFARSEWTDHQLELAGMLARAMADLEREQFDLRAEGSVMSSERGTPVVNPRKQVVQMLAGTILSMRRSLSLHARAQMGEARNVAKRQDQAKAIETDLGDDLLARPSLQ